MALESKSRKTLALNELTSTPDSPTITASSDPHDLTYVIEEALGFRSDLPNL